MNRASDKLTILLESFSSGNDSRSFLFKNCVETITADNITDVIPAMKRIEKLVEQGFHAAGYVGYEAGAAFNKDLPVSRFSNALPLLLFGIFKQREEIKKENATEYLSAPFCIGKPVFSVSQEQFTSAVKTIKQYIANGDTYQVNYTIRARFPFSGDPTTIYRHICNNQRSEYCTCINIGAIQILSASPELFFSLKDSIITMKPMKGTMGRHLTADGDNEHREKLKNSEKERAENLMIVDLVRNDLGMIAETGSVQVTSLFDVETYPTVHQMTSTVQATLKKEIGITDVFSALFPCGSVTGAPKRRTMEIIDNLESDPREVYCGAIGYISPAREAVFSVAIRTAVLDHTQHRCTLGIGGGITWDSDPLAEFNEAISKSAFMTRTVPDFELIESLRHDTAGYLLLEQHLKRLYDSARYFDFRFDRYTIEEKLKEISSTLNIASKVRIVLHKSGEVTITSERLPKSCRDNVTWISVSRMLQDQENQFLYHKTTNRQLYDDERKKHPDCYDTIFLNRHGEITEGSYNSIVISIDGKLLTPALGCGLLPGVLRQELLTVGAISEAVLTLKELQSAEKIWLVNSVRGWQECKMKKMSLE